MKQRNIKVDGSTFTVGSNVLVRQVSVDGKPVQWRMHRKQSNTVELRTPHKGNVTVDYDVTVPVEVAAYYPLKPRKSATAS